MTEPDLDLFGRQLEENGKKKGGERCLGIIVVDGWRAAHP